MPNERILNFLKECNNNCELQEELSKVAPKDKYSLVKIAIQAGYNFTVEEWAEYEKSLISNKSELSEDDLDKVSGGRSTENCTKEFDYWLCFCSNCPYFRCKKAGQKYVFGCENGHFSGILE